MVDRNALDLMHVTIYKNKDGYINLKLKSEEDGTNKILVMNKKETLHMAYLLFTKAFFSKCKK